MKYSCLSLSLLYYCYCCCCQVTVAQVTCQSEFGTSRTIAADRINDGYCDCPLNGLDEPQTEACSGALVGGWAGVPARKHDGVKFTCPQQHNLSIPVSRINDGVCDCCDGADEPSGRCNDVCEQVLQKERERVRLVKENFVKGHARRQEELAAYQEMIVSTEAELDSLTEEYNTVQKQVDTVEQELATLKHANLKKRLLAMKDTIMSLSHESGQDEPLKGLLEPLSEEGLVTVIVQACQLAGEQETASGRTCVPLRLAGLDVGIVWGKEDFKEGTVSEERMDLSTTAWQDLIDRNAAGETVWSVDDVSPSVASSHRRLMDDHHDDDIAYDENHWDEEDEDFPEPYDDHYDEDYEHQFEDDEVELNQDLLDGVKAYAFSAARLSFLNRASHLIAKIDDMLKISNDEEEEEEEEEEGKEQSTGMRTNVDPMVIQEVRNILWKRQESIQRGLQYAVSAEILIKPFQGSHPDLVALAAGTLYHGMIRSSDLWQILAYMTVEFPTHACFSPWAILCPPQVSNENGTPFPPLPIVKAVEQFCEGEHTDASIICDTEEEEEEIPTKIHDHYYGYSVIEPRDEQDVLSKAFARLDNVIDRSEIVQLEEQRDELKTKQDTLSNQMQDLEDRMGGRDHSKYGSQGELYSLRDSCHSVQEGKYDYEVCIFGRAQQKEHGRSSGTGLGSWKGSNVDPETGLRKLEWTRGQKCWNGPERSATVFVTCGAENRLLSAEEPDTCRYVLEMESYIACDDDYKQRHGL